MFSPEAGSKGTSKKKAYLFAAVFSLVILILLVIFNLRPEAIQQIVRQMIGGPK
jgi:hypothetical protein